MKLRLTIIAAVPVVLAVAALPAAAADVTGTWVVDGSVMGYAVKPTCTIKQDENNKLTGNCTSDVGEVPLTGDDADGTVKWEYKVNDKGSTHDLQFTGTLDGDKAMKGKFKADGWSGKFTAQAQ